jgi:hypothetical protein
MVIVVIIRVRVLQSFFCIFSFIRIFHLLPWFVTMKYNCVCQKNRRHGDSSHHTQLSGSEYMSLFHDVSDHISFDSPSSNDAASKYIQPLFLPGKATLIDEKLWLNMTFHLIIVSTPGRSSAQ